MTANETVPGRAARPGDVSSFTAWEHLGAELVLGEVRVDGELTERRSSARIDSVGLDPTGKRSTGREDVRAFAVVTTAEIEAKRATVRPELADRIATFRSRADAEPASGPA